MTNAGWVSLLPPLLAMAVAVRSRQVYLALAGGVWLGWTIALDWNPVAALALSIDKTVAVLTDEGDAKVLIFTLVMGALIATLEASGGVRGFIAYIERNQWVTTPKRAQFLAWLIGLVIFIESNITVLVAGSVCRPLFDRHRTSREKLAYIIDSTSAPVCILIPLNAWGAYILSLLAGLGVDDPLGVFAQSMAYNFYAIVTVALTLFVIGRQWDIGPMRRAEERAQTGVVLWPEATPMMDESVWSAPEGAADRGGAVDMLAPIGTMVLMMPVGLFITGEGRLQEGSGATSVLWAALAGLTVAWMLALPRRLLSLDQLVRIGLRGAGGLMPLAFMLLLALALGDVAMELGTGDYVAQVATQALPPALFLPLIFLVGAAIAFCIGSSWGTFAIMIPIAVPAAASLHLPLAPFVAASLSGGVFGDHCSPISDTTVISSMAAATDHIDHVRTQLPYGLIAAGISMVLFAIVGATL